MGYGAYREMIDRLLAEGKTTGENHSANMIKYTRLNVQRMQRIDKTYDLSHETIEMLKSLKGRYFWVVLAEGWCGDVAQNLPVLAKMANTADHIDLKILLRDENPDVIDAHLTDGGRSIPKLIVLNAETLAEIASWGPRPDPAQQMMKEFKNNGNSRGKMDVINNIQKWYSKDQSETLQKEIKELMMKCEDYARIN